jgi:hypothetical protein
MSGDLSRHAPAWLKTRWAEVLGGFLAAVLVLALLAPYLVNIDRYRDRISDTISLQTGRKVTLGRLRLTVLPRVGFTADGLRVANPPGFAQGQLVRAEAIRGSLAFWPLVLRGELRVISLELVQPRLTLLEDAAGRNNYTFSSGLAAKPRQGQASHTPSTFVTLRVDRVAMTDAAVFYGTVDRQGRPAATVYASNLDLELRQIAMQPLRIRDWEGDAHLGGTQLTLTGWNAPILFDSGLVTLHRGQMDSSFTVQFGDAARIEGNVTVPDIEHAAPQFDLKTADLDLDALLAGAAEPIPARAGNVNPAAIFGRSDRTPGTPLRAVIPVATASPAAPSQLVAQGHIAAERIHQGNYRAGPLAVDLRIFNDRTEIWPFTLRLAGGAVQLTARTDRRQVPQRFSANIQVHGLNAERMLRNWPGLKGKFAGTTELDVQLVGSLERHWTESLAGNGQFLIRNGRIAGFNLASAARSLDDPPGVRNDTPFTRVAGDLSIRNGRVSSRQIHMDSPSGMLDLRGSCGFYGTLDYAGRIIAPVGAGSNPAAGEDGILPAASGNAVVQNISQRQITVPFLLSGTLQQPQFRLGGTAPRFTQTAQSDHLDLFTQPQNTNGSSFPNLFDR